jgi:two-component system, OmpR family, phosphate regulon sensor histidine kinase PhoR
MVHVSFTIDFGPSLGKGHTMFDRHAYCDGAVPGGGRSHPHRSKRVRGLESRRTNDLLLRWLGGIAVGLALFYGVLALFWGSGAVIAVLPWYVPMMHSFAALAAFGIAFLALGRYRVTREPAPFWIGMGFVSFGILALFYVLSWPGLLPDERGLIAKLPNTSEGLLHLQFSALAVCLLAAVLLPWPRGEARGERWWTWLIAVGVLASFAIAGLSVLFERAMPLLVSDGSWTPLHVVWFSALLAAFAIGTLLSAHRYRQTGDALVGYVALMQLLLSFFMLAGVISGNRYDLWWYWQRILLVGGFSSMLFGLLSEYVELYRLERERTRELEALQQVTDPVLARQGLESLLQGLLERIVAIMDAHAGAILLLDPQRQELVLRKGVGIAEEEAVGLRVAMGEDFAGRVAAGNAVLWVRDAQSDPTIWNPYIRAGHIRGMLGAPMRIGAECTGVVHVDFLETREFTPDEEHLLEVVAERVALAIRQAMLLEEAQEERNRLRVLIDTAPTGIIFCSAPDGALVLFNKASEVILGRSLAPRVGTASRPVFSGALRPDGKPFHRGELPVSRSLRGETCSGVEMLLRQPSGRKVFVLANCAPIRDAKGQVVGAVVAFQDITPIREQEQLRDEFVSAAAHELKTPVTTIKGYAQLMHQWAPEGHEPREGKAVEVISAQADRINRRVQEMLEVIRYRKGPFDLHRARFDLAELATEVVQRIQSTTQIHQLVLLREGPVPVEGDLEHVEEVIVGLLDNAMKYSPKGGEIEVRVWAHDMDALLSVKDHGVGIPKERQSHIFEPFYEPVPAGAPGYHSVVALSLYLGKLVIDRNRGSIWFESEEGKGSTFYFRLPLASGGGDGQQG